jgi:predicted O-methyltransferase YrrM
MPKGFLPEPLASYIDRTFVHESDLLRRLREETAKMPESGMQISADQGEFISLLIGLIGATRTLEVGVFTGYSSLCTLLALPENGHHTALDISAEYTNVAKRYWAEAGVANKADLRIGPALASMDALLAEGNKFDFCFIDADKPNYSNYYERAVQLVRKGGLIAIDNTLWSGKVADATDMDESTAAIRQINALVAGDPRVEESLVPIGDGLLLARVR